MSDFLLEMSKSGKARKVIQTAGLPVPLPPVLKRAKGPWEEMPLMDLPVAVGHLPGSELAGTLAQSLGRAGAKLLVSADDKTFAQYKAMGEAWGRIPEALAMDAAPEGVSPHGMIFDATGVKSPGDLIHLYSFFHSKLRSLAKCGRALVIGRPFETMPDVPSAAASRGLEGFVRSLGKEVGKKGATAQFIAVEPGAEDRLEPVLRFFLSYRSAFVDGQPIRVSCAVAAPRDITLTRPLDGKVALVTGAAQGIGKAIAETLALEGAHVVCVDRPAEEERTAVLARELKGSALHLDITAPDAAAKITRHVKKTGKPLSALIHNAGVTRDKMLVNMDADRWNMALNVNLVSVMAVTEKLMGILDRNARVVCLSSIAGIAGNPGQTNYAASKAGIIGFVKALAPAVAKKGITVNAVAPGFIETRMTAAIPFGTRQAGRRLASLSQGGLPEDVAQVVTFLATPQSYGVTGEVIRICGQSLIGA